MDPALVRVLIVRLSAMGDVIHALPVARNIKQTGVEVGWLTEPRYAALLEGNPSVDRIFTADTRRWRRSAFHRDTVRSISRLRSALRDFAPEVTLDVQGLWKSAVLARLAGAPVVGFAAANRREPASAALCDLHVRLPDQHRHVVDQNLALLDKIGIAISERAPDARYLLRTSSGPADAFLARLPGPFALYHPGSARAEKAWGEANYAELARRLYDERGFLPVISWGPGDESRAKRMAELLPMAVAPLLDFLGLARLSVSSRLFIAGDTGPLHLADALGVPTICLLPVDARNPPWRNGPYRGHAVSYGQGVGVESVTAQVREAISEVYGRSDLRPRAGGTTALPDMNAER
jgi:lipopolysaccharide heptosyltransferase I